MHLSHLRGPIHRLIILNNGNRNVFYVCKHHMGNSNPRSYAGGRAFFTFDKSQNQLIG
ncbi:Uncharacterised protein [Vibrio cholerae]|nr:Uncharacterised protein [Vibrio cholerae]